MTSGQIEIQLIAVVVAVACALPGTFLVLRRLALVSDAISHSILLGIVLGFFVVGNVNSPVLLLAPRRGIVWREVRGRRDRRKLRLAAVLADLRALELQHPGAEHGHSAGVLSIMSGGAEASLRELEDRGLVKRLGDDAWALTDAGRAEATR